MGINVTSQFGGHRRKLLLVSLLIAVLIITSMFIYVFFVQHDTSPVSGDVAVRTEVELVNAVDNAVEPIVITFDNDIQLTSSLTIPANKNITLTSNRSNGFFKLMGTQSVNTITVERGGVLSLDGVIVTHAQNVRGRGVYVASGGTLVMVGGEISGNKATYQGGGVQNEGYFVMYGGKILGNDVYDISSRGGGYHLGGSGGGVYNRGVFEMFGGVISDNSAGCGGGVCNYGTFTLHDGEDFW
jgi:hypothetical protein